MKIKLLIVCSALTLTCAIDTDKNGRVKRKSAFTNIISNYFTTDPFFKAKQKPRIHLPPKLLPRVELSNIPPTNMQQPLNAQSQQQSSSNIYSPRPVPIKLGPPIRILPTINKASLKHRMLTFQKPTSYKTGHSPPQNQGKGKIPAPLLVGGGNQEKQQKRIPAPLVVRNDISKSINQNQMTQKDPRQSYQNKNNVNPNRRQSFSQLISKPKKPVEKKQPVFQNFPIQENKRQNSGFKLSPDMPFSFPGDHRNDIPALQVIEKGRAPLITFKDEEELRYQNDYFQLPERETFDNDIQNDIFQDFEVPKINKNKPSRYPVKPDKPMKHKETPNYFSKPEKLIKYSKPPNYFNPMDKFHNQNDVEFFESPQMPYTQEEPKYSNYKKSSHFHEEKLSELKYKPMDQPHIHQAKKIDSGYNNFPHDNSGFFDIPKLGAMPSGHGFDRPSFPSPDVSAHLDYHKEIKPPAYNPPNNQPTTVADFSPPSYNPPSIRPTRTPDFSPPAYSPRYSRPDPVQYTTPPPFNPPKQQPQVFKEFAAPAYQPPHKEPPLQPVQHIKSSWGATDYNGNYGDYDDYSDYQYNTKEYNNNEYQYDETEYYHEPRSFPDPPQHSTVHHQPRSLDIIPAPLPPPPGLIDMQHNSVFSAPFDVPKLGTGGEYKPPEVIYNEMYETPKNHFSNLFPKSEPKKQYRSFPEPAEPPKQYRSFPEPPKKYSPTPAPFLPTPAKEPYKPKPFSEYAELYDAPKKPYNRIKIKRPTYEKPMQTKVPPYVPPPTKAPSYNSNDDYHKYHDSGNIHEQNFFKPMNSPSITFEPDFTNEIDDNSHYYNGNMLHAIVQSEFDYEEPQSREDPVFIPYNDDKTAEPVLRAESVVTPVPANFLRSNFFNEVSEPRYKRYQAVDYSPQSPENYNYEPLKFNAPYPPEPYHQPTPEPAHFKHQVPAFLPPPENFVQEPDFHTSDYYSPEYQGSDYYASDYQGSEYHGSDYQGSDYQGSDYHGSDYPGPDYHGSDYHGQEFPELDFHDPGIKSGTIPLRPKGRSLWDDDVTTNSNQFVNVAGVDTYEHGHVRGNPVHKKQEYTRREGRHFKSQVSWADGDEGYGKHYYEYNH